MFIKNTLGVLAGIAVAVTLILFGITLNKVWFDELDNIDLQQKGEVFLYWRSVIKQAPTNFFIALLVSGGIGATVGGVTTGLLVQRARPAYALLIGGILFFMALADVILFRGHPTWYIIAMFFIYFPFAWLGGKIVDRLMEEDIISKH